MWILTLGRLCFFVYVVKLILLIFVIIIVKSTKMNKKSPGMGQLGTRTNKTETFFPMWQNLSKNLDMRRRVVYFVSARLSRNCALIVSEQLARGCNSIILALALTQRPVLTSIYKYKLVMRFRENGKYDVTKINLTLYANWNCRTQSHSTNINRQAKQLTGNIFSIKVADDWIRNRVL